MRICHISKDESEASGVYTFVANLAKSLTAYGVESVVARSYQDYWMRYKQIPDIVHIHGLWVHHLDFIQVKLNKVKIVWSTHGMTAPWALRFKWMKKCLSWWLAQRWELKFADRIHCTSEKERQWNRALGFEKTFLAPVGTNLCKSLSPTRVTSKGPRQLLFVGRVHPVKNIDTLIRAFSEVASTVRSGWRLRIVGPGREEYVSKLENIARSCGVSDVVDFAGPSYGSDLTLTYCQCDCLALVSHTENFGATVVDALAAGKPVITSKGTPWSVVKEKRCGWWVDNSIEALTDAISEMMSISSEERQEMGQRGRQLVREHYTWDAVGRTMKCAYEEMLHEG